MMVWLSFANPDNRNDSWLGVAIVEIEAQTYDVAALTLALQTAYRAGINPGGEVAGYRLAPETEAEYRPYLGRLLNRADMAVLEAERFKR